MGAQRLFRDKIAPRGNDLPPPPLVTRSPPLIPDFPPPRPEKKHFPSSEEDETTTQEPNIRRLRRRLSSVQYSPIANNGGTGNGNGHGGRHPRSLPIPSTTKAGNRSPDKESSENSNDYITTKDQNSENVNNHDNRVPRHPSDHDDNNHPVPFGTQPNQNVPRDIPKKRFIFFFFFFFFFF